MTRFGIPVIFAVIQLICLRKNPAEIHRAEIEEMVEGQVNLKLWVKVRREWRDSELYLKNYGYNPKDVNE